MADGKKRRELIDLDMSDYLFTPTQLTTIKFKSGISFSFNMRICPVDKDSLPE